MLINKDHLLHQLDGRPEDGWISVQAVRSMIEGEPTQSNASNVLERVGEWIEIERDDVNPLTGRRGVYVGCSECHAPIPTDSQLDYLDEADCEYCYCCGARMVKE